MNAEKQRDALFTYSNPNLLHSLALNTAIPSLLKPLPSPNWLLTHLHITNHHVIIPILGQFSLTNIPAHGNINHDSELLHSTGAKRDVALHNRSAINVPNHATAPVGDAIFLYPGEAKGMGLARHGRKMGFDNAMLVVVWAVEVAPMEATVVYAVAIPGLEDVDFAVSRPLKGVFWEHPVGGPDAFCDGGQDGGGQIAARAVEGLV